MDLEKSQQLLLPCSSTIHFYSWTSCDPLLWRPQLSPFFRAASALFPSWACLAHLFKRASEWHFLANNQSQLAMICANSVCVLTGKTEPRTFYLFYWSEKPNCHVVPERLNWPEDYYRLRSQYLNYEWQPCPQFTESWKCGLLIPKQ